MSGFPFDLSKLDLSSIMDMARGLKEKMKQLEDELKRTEVEAVVGGGMVTVKANAAGQILSVKIDNELVEMKDKVMLENLVTSGINQALEDARVKREEKTRELAGGFGLPGIPGLF